MIWPGPVAVIRSRAIHWATSTRRSLSLSQPRGVPFESGVCHVVLDRSREGQPFGLAVFAGEPDPLLDSCSRSCVTAGELLDPDPPRDDRAEPKNGTHQRGPARADQPGNAQDFAAPEHQAHGFRRLPDAKLVDLEYRVAGGMRHAGKELFQVAADHRSDDRLQVRFRQLPSSDRFTVS